MSGAPRDWLADVEAASRQIAGDVFGLPEVECVNGCGAWVKPGSASGCNHEPAVCADCYPNGCERCEWQEHETLRHREEATSRIMSGTLALRVGADDLSETDLSELDWRVRTDLIRHTALTIETLRRVHDVLAGIEEKAQRLSDTMRSNGQ